MEKIRISALHLLSIITDLLDLTRLENGTAQLNVSRFSVAELIAEVLTKLQPAACGNGNKLETHNRLTVDMVEADRARLREALERVIDNACKYTNEGVITVTVEDNPLLEGIMLTFRVADNGIGISLDQQESIFSVFVQGDDSTTRRFDGLGLGLAKSRGYCRLMGGEITLKTEHGKGSEFTISIPVKVAALTDRQQATT
jgi:hypothetical protein